MYYAIDKNVQSPPLTPGFLGLGRHLGANGSGERTPAVPAATGPADGENRLSAIGNW
jgi:hypothetical protein